VTSDDRISGRIRRYRLAEREKENVQQKTKLEEGQLKNSSDTGGGFLIDGKGERRRKTLPRLQKLKKTGF